MASTTRTRRTLHQPFIPFLPTPSPPTTAPPPFFPYPPPPPPPPPLPTFPSNSPPSHSSLSCPLALLIVLPSATIALLFLTLTILLLLHRRRHSTPNSPQHTTLDLPKTSAANSSPTTSDILYLGTLVSSYAATSTSSPPHVLDSPELQPLPPLTRRSLAEKFDYPRGRRSSPRMLDAAVTLSSSPYSSSELMSSPSPLSSPPISSSTGESNVESPSSAGTGYTPPLPPRFLWSHTKPASIQTSIHPPPSSPHPAPLHTQLATSIREFVRPLPPPSPQQAPLHTQLTTRITEFVSPPPPPPPPLARHRDANDHCPPVLKPPRAIGAENAEEKVEYRHRTKLRPLYWDKVRASPDMVWDQLRSSSFELDEEMITALFHCETANSASKEAAWRQFSSSPSPENRILDPKKSYNIEIQLKALNATKEKVCRALLECSADTLSNDLMQALLKMAPNKEEEFKLKECRYNLTFKLGPAEMFLMAVLDIPFAFKRLEAMIYISNFDLEVNCLLNSFQTLEAAYTELRSNRLFLKLLEAVLKTGNRMNIGTNRGNAQAFKLETLLKLTDVKGTDGKTTLMHFVVEEISKAEGSKLFAANHSTVGTNAGKPSGVLECKMLGLQAVSALGREISNVKKAATMDPDALSGPITRLAIGVGKINELVTLNNGLSLKERSQHLHDAMTAFLEYAEDKIIKLQAQERTSMAKLKELTVYFHGNSKNEGHPFRLFTVVRDFLGILDQVCRDVSSTHLVPVHASSTNFPSSPCLKS